MGAIFCKQEVAAKQKKEPTLDFYRCSHIRNMGFASVILSKMVPSTVAHVPQMAATTYILSDVFSKAMESLDNDKKQSKALATAIDALLWQTMVSVLAPLLLYGSLKSATSMLFLKKAKIPRNPKLNKCQPIQAKPKPLPSQEEMKKEPLFIKFIPGTISLLLMPYMMNHLQAYTHDLMDMTYRKWFAAYLREPTPEEIKEQEAAEKLRAEQAKKEAEEKLRKAEEAEKERLRKLKEAEALAAEKAKQKAIEEREAKERLRQKCLEEEKLLKERLAAEEAAIKEKLKQEELMLAEKRAKLEKEIKDKAAQKKMECD